MLRHPQPGANGSHASDPPAFVGRHGSPPCINGAASLSCQRSAELNEHLYIGHADQYNQLAHGAKKDVSEVTEMLRCLHSLILRVGRSCVVFQDLPQCLAQKFAPGQEPVPPPGP